MNKLHCLISKSALSKSIKMSDQKLIEDATFYTTFSIDVLIDNAIIEEFCYYEDLIKGLRNKAIKNE